MAKVKYIMILSVLLGTILQSAESIRCFNCQGCSNPFNWESSPILSCTSDKTCMKTIDNRSGVTVVKRECYSRAQCVESEEPNFSTYCCNTDLCNSAKNNKVQNLFSLFSIFVVSISLFC